MCIFYFIYKYGTYLVGFSWIWQDSAGHTYDVVIASFIKKRLKKYLSELKFDKIV